MPDEKAPEKAPTTPPPAPAPREPSARRAAQPSREPELVTRVVAHGSLIDKDGKALEGETVTVPKEDAERFERDGILTTEEGWAAMQDLKRAQANVEAVKAKTSEHAPPGHGPTAPDKPSLTANERDAQGAKTGLPPDLARYQEGGDKGKKEHK